MKRYTDLFLDFDDTLYDTHGNAVGIQAVGARERHFPGFHNFSSSAIIESFLSL